MASAVVSRASVHLSLDWIAHFEERELCECASIRDRIHHEAGSASPAYATGTATASGTGTGTGFVRVIYLGLSELYTWVCPGQKKERHG